MLEFIARKQQQLKEEFGIESIDDASRYRAEITQQLGLSERQAQALCEAYHLHRALEMGPVLIEQLLGVEA